VVKKCESLGFIIDESKNKKIPDENVTEISNATNPKVLVCHTDEKVSLMPNKLTRNLSNIIPGRNGAYVYRNPESIAYSAPIPIYFCSLARTVSSTSLGMP
jgi:hypothetical protein